MKRFAISAAIAFALLVPVAACGGGSDQPAAASSPTSSTSSATATPTPSPTPPTLTVKEAAARYLAIDKPYTVARKRLVHDLDVTLSFTKIRKDGKAAQRALETKIKAMLNTPWPPAVQKYVDSYVAKASQGVDTFRDISRAHDIGDLLNSGSTRATQIINGAEVLLRIKLGLPQK